MGDLIEGEGDVIKSMAVPGVVWDLWVSNIALAKVDLMSYCYDTIPTRNGRELGEIWVSKVGTNF